MAREALSSNNPLIRTLPQPAPLPVPPSAALPSRHEGTCQPADRDTAWPKPVAGHGEGESEKGEEEEWRREGSSVSPPNQTNQGFPPQEGEANTSKKGRRNLSVASPSRLMWLLKPSFLLLLPRLIAKGGRGAQTGEKRGGRFPYGRLPVLSSCFACKDPFFALLRVAGFLITSGK